MNNRDINNKKNVEEITVLLVEDQAVIRMAMIGALKQALSYNKINILTAVDGYQAIELYKTYEHPIDLAIIDFNLIPADKSKPMITGFEVAAFIRQSEKELKKENKIFILTWSASVASKEVGYNYKGNYEAPYTYDDDTLCANGRLQKPITPEPLKISLKDFGFNTKPLKNSSVVSNTPVVSHTLAIPTSSVTDTPNTNTSDDDVSRTKQLLPGSKHPSREHSKEIYSPLSGNVITPSKEENSIIIEQEKPVHVATEEKNEHSSSLTNSTATTSESTTNEGTHLRSSSKVGLNGSTHIRFFTDSTDGKDKEKTVEEERPKPKTNPCKRFCTIV